VATLKGAKELRRRMKAIKQVFKPVGRQWADETADRARRYVPKRTGKTAKSIRRKNASMKRATVQARYQARILMAGSKPHDIRPKKMQAVKFNVAGQPRFSKRVRHPGHGKNDFAERAAEEALAKNPMADELIRLWNEAA
jgi:hypothetical protein